jgi:hypothetical protein
MVARDLKQMLKSEKDLNQEEESSNEKDDMSLFNLVRGGSKKRVNFLVTSAEEGKEYVPSRYSSLMINAKEGKDKFKPRRGRSEKGKDDKEPNDEKGKTHTRFATPRKKRTPPSSSSSGDEAIENPKRKEQKKGRSTKSNKQASVEGDRGLHESSDRTLDTRGAGVPSSSSAFKASPPKERWTWGSTDDVAFKPAWGGLKGYDDHQDDKRIDGEWGETQEKHDRRNQDKCGKR